MGIQIAELQGVGGFHPMRLTDSKKLGSLGVNMFKKA